MGGSSSKKREKKRARRTLKLIALGTSATGKSTFFRQLKIIHQGGFDQIENQNFVRILKANFLLGFKESCWIVSEWDMKVRSKNKSACKYFKNIDVDGDNEIDHKVIEYSRSLWKDPAIKEIWKEKDSLPKFTITNLDYLVENIERLAAHDAVAINDDIIRCRQRTTGVSNFYFKLEKCFVNFVDLGGQYIERRKWASVSAGSAAMLFFASLIDYDIPLPDDSTTRMEESLHVWKNMIQQDIFEHSTVILFLNKSDLFEEKIQKVDLSEYYPDYEGGSHFDEGVDYIKNKYLLELEDSYVKEENTYVHITCALDTNLMGDIFDDIIQQIFKQRLAASGLPTIMT